MAPKTPQGGSSKLPKPPSAGGAIPLTGIPGPNVLQRRTFASNNSTTSSPIISKALSNMTPEQQSLLAEAISMHSPGLIDPGRTKPNSSASSNTVAGTGVATGPSTGSSIGGMGSIGGGAFGSSYINTSTSSSAGSINSNGGSNRSPTAGPFSTSGASTPTSVASPLTYRSSSSSSSSSSSQLGTQRRLTGNGATIPGVDQAFQQTTQTQTHQQLQQHQLSRPSSYSSTSPVPRSAPGGGGLMTNTSATTPATASPSPSLNTNPSTRASNMVAPGSGTSSPSSTRPSLPMSRLSGVPGARAGLLRQPGLIRPTASGPAASPAAGACLGSNSSSHLPGAAVVPPSLDDYVIGDRVIVESMDLSGFLRFLGPTDFKSGTWAGIELDTPTGKNDGSVNGIEYFQCRPKYGIFVLAAKIAKSESLFPTSPVLANVRPPAIPPVSATLLAETQSPPPALQQQASAAKENQNHAAQAASKITAGSRASKYIGMTASQLKQRNGMAQTSTNSMAGSRLSLQSNASTGSINTTSTGIRAASPTVRSPLSSSGSPTNARTIGATAPGMGNRASSPSPAPRLGIRANSPTTRATGAASTATLGGSRLALAASKPSTGTMAASRMPATAIVPTTHSRSTSSTSSITSTAGPRARTSPTPGRVMTTPRRLSSRSDTPDTSHILTPSDSRANLLDQATTIQTTNATTGVVAVEGVASSPQDENFAQKIHQLQLDLGVMVAENNLLKTEVNQARSQLESARLLEKQTTMDDERLGKELEELQSLKEQWEKEKKAKDQEIQVMTEKMTQAWLEVARSQKEKTTLQEKLKTIEEGGGDAAAAVAALNAAEHQQALIEEKDEAVQRQLALIESLQRDLAEADARSKTFESRLEEVVAKAAETEKAAQKTSETLEANEIEYTQKLTALTQERDGLQATLTNMEVSARNATESTSQQLTDLTQAAEATKLALEAKIQDLEQDLATVKESEAEAAAKILTMQTELSDAERQTKLLEEKTKQLEGIAAKREQEIASLKLELEDIAGMVQSEEVERMRKVWENEKKRLEEAVADNITVITNQRAEIQTLEQAEEALETKVKELEAKMSDLTIAKEAAEAEMIKVKDQEDSLKSRLEQEREELRKSLEAQLIETKEELTKLEVVVQTVDEWRERCEAMQLEVIQKTAAFEDIGFQLSDSLVRQEKLREEYKKEKQILEDKLASESTRLEEALSKSQTEVKALEAEQGKLKTKISELETALTVSASTPSTVVASQPHAADSDAAATIADLEDEIANLKQMVHDLTRENVQVASINKKLMQEHDNLMEAHKHVETECLKLMDEVERLHAENLAMPMSMEDAEVHHSHRVDIKDEIDMIHAESNAKTVMNGGDVKKTPVDSAETTNADDKPSNQSESVIRLENLLKEKQALLDRLTQQHAAELKELRQKVVELDRSKAWEVQQLNKELTELESLIESKIFHEADLEEEVQLKQKQIDRLEREVTDLKNQLRQLSNGGAGGSLVNGSGSGAANPPSSASAPASAPASTVYMPRSTAANGAATSATSLTSRALQLEENGAEDSKPLFCEICEVEGHDIISCVAVFGGAKGSNSSSKIFAAQPVPNAPVFAAEDIEDDRPYCDNCEEFGDHWTDECPNESLTY